MVLENKLGLNDSVELAKMEEQISKKRAMELFESGRLNDLEAGTFQALVEIHKYLFEQIYDFAGKVRDVNIAKGSSFHIHSFLLRVMQNRMMKEKLHF